MNKYNEGFVLKTTENEYIKINWSTNNSKFSMNFEIVENLNEATVFDELPFVLLNSIDKEYGWSIKHVNISNEIKITNEWNILSEKEPLNKQKVKIKFNGLEVDALYEEKIGQFLDYSSLTVIKSENDEWKNI